MREADQVDSYIKVNEADNIDRKPGSLTRQLLPELTEIVVQSGSERGKR